MSEREALYRTVRESPEDDVPRLVYADWLQENGDEPRAEFIRVQVKLASLSRSDPEWAECRVRERELLAAHGHRFDAEFPQLDGLPISWNPTDAFGEEAFPFERGFREWAVISPRSPGEFAEAAYELAATTHVRNAELTTRLHDSIFGDFLHPNAVGQLTGLALNWHRDAGFQSGVYRSAPNGLPNLRCLRNLTPATGVQLAAWSASRKRPRWDRLAFRLGDGITVSDLGSFFAQLTCSPLRDLTIQADPPAGPGLRTVLEIGPPELRRLEFHSGVGRQPEYWPGVLAELRDERKLPQLDSLHLGGIRLRAEDVFSLCGSDRLRELSLSGAELSASVVLAFRDATGTASLSSLSVAAEPLTEPVLRWLGSVPSFANLRSLELRGSRADLMGVRSLVTSEHLAGLRRLTVATPSDASDSADPARELDSFELPNLTSLDLSGMPLGVAGAEALSRQPCLSRLRALWLNDCRINANGMEALLRSPHLQGLEYLDLADNYAGGGVDALADPDVMPRLGRCDLTGNGLTDGMVADLRKRPEVNA